MHECAFCGEFASPHNGPLKDYPGGRGRILFEVGPWITLPSLGPLARGHLLVLPRDHYRSIAAAAHALDVKDLLVVLAMIEERLDRDASALLLVFEHGEPESGMARAGACIDHAHLHVVPINPHLSSGVVNWADDWIRSPDLQVALANSNRDGYHLVGYLDGPDGFYTRAVVGASPSQFLRRIVATALDNPRDWDWRTHPAIDDVALAVRAWHSTQ